MDPITLFLLGAAAGGLLEAVKWILESKRSVVIPSFKVSKEFKQELTEVAKLHGWSEGQTAYIAASIGLKKIRMNDEEQKRLAEKKH